MSQYSVEIITRGNVTYDKVRDMVRVKTDVFRNDTVWGVFQTVETSLADNSLPPVYDYERLRRKLMHFQIIADFGMRHSYHDLLTNDRTRVYVLKNAANDYVGCAYVYLPQYAPIAHPFSALRWIKGVYWKIRCILGDLFRPWSMLKPLVDEVHWAADETGIGANPENIIALKNMDKEQLATAAYPQDLSYWVSEFGIRSDEQQKGLGRVLMDFMVEDLRKLAQPPHNLNPAAPAKLELQSTPTARKFYERLGFTCYGTAQHEVNGTHLVHSTYYLNL